MPSKAMLFVRAVDKTKAGAESSGESFQLLHGKGTFSSSGAECRSSHIPWPLGKFSSIRSR